jgi:3-hydroxybutyryl-CoA dehydrogenase
VEIARVFVMGAGTMGSGIAQVVTEAGYRVVLEDIDVERTARAIQAIERGLEKGRRKGRIDERGKAKAMSRITTATALDAASDADLVIEAIPEDLVLKKAAFAELDRICPAKTILASNTSALPIAEIAAATTRQSKVIGIHFMNPVPAVGGVEIIRGRNTSEDTFRTSKAFVVSLGKEPCEAADFAGFIVSRILDAMLNEAFYCVMDGNAPEEVDKAMKTCANLPMGPLELCDLVGADVVFQGLQSLHQEFGERLRPAPLVRSMVRAGDLGRKTGHGFYHHGNKL